MNIGKTLYVHTRKAWRTWLSNNHASAKEIWLVYYKKDSGKPRIPYNHAVEEALCYGWIDSILKPIDTEKYAQRFSPRKSNAKWSPMNIERLRRLMRQKKVTRAGLKAAASIPGPRRSRTLSQSHAQPGIPPDILKRLRKDRTTWNNFKRFPPSYKRIRIGWIEGARRRPDVFAQRLLYFLRMTKQNKRFGMVQ
jgi:uncharacterized protein YdeI (YjbR/CyaY-like superfamily)